MTDREIVIRKVDKDGAIILLHQELYCSFQPHHIKSSIVSCQLLGLKRICSDIYDYEHGVKILTQSHLSWGYPYILISEQINYASHIIRTKSLTRIFNRNTMKNASPSIHSYIHPSLLFWKMQIMTGWTSVQTIALIISCPIPSYLPINNHVICNSCISVLRTHFYNVVNHVTNHDVKFFHILISDAVSNFKIMSQSLLPKLTVTHTTWSTFYFVLFARTLFMLVKLPTVLDFDLTIKNTALNTIFMVIP